MKQLTKEEIINRLSEIQNHLRFLNGRSGDYINLTHLDYRCSVKLNSKMLKASLLIEQECLEETLKEMLNEEVKDE